MISRAVVAGALGLALVGPLAQGDPTPAQLAWLRRHAIEIKTVEAGTGFSDLAKLKTAIGDARIVSLGEATHGSREIFQMKHRLVEFLATELGFTIFSIEANMPEAYRLNDYVLGGKGDPKALLKGMYFWTWNTEEVLAMIEWMRQFNASGKGRIQFTGFDMQTATVAIDAVLDFLGTAEPSYATDVRTTYDAIRKLREQAGATAFGVATGTFPVSAAAGKKIKFSGAIRTELTDGWAGLWWRADGPKGVLAFDNMQARSVTGTTDWKRYEIALDVPAETTNINFGVLMPGKGRAWFDDLRVEIDGEPYAAGERFDFDFEKGALQGFFTPPPRAYRAAPDNRFASRGTQSLLIESIAEAGAATASGIAPAEASRKAGEIVARMEGARDAYLKRADARAVDWAIQNARVVRQYSQMIANEAPRDESMARNVKWIVDTAPKGTRVVLWAHNGHVNRQQHRPFRAMGSYLDDWYGKDHLVVGFATNRGEYTAVGRGSGLGRHPLAKAEPGSYEYVFSRVGIPRFVLDVRASRADDAASGWLRQPLTFRSIGAMAMDTQFHVADLANLYDLIVFLDETSPTRGLWESK